MIAFGRNNESSRLHWLQRYLARLPQGLKVLDAGAGELRNKAYCKHLQYVSQDFCQYEGKGDGVALQTGEWDTTRIDIVSDITAIPVADGSFDVVLCTEVLEHVPDSLSALRELARVVKPQGQMILTAPFCSLTHFAPYHYATGLSRYWYEKHLEALGFTMVEVRPNGGWLDYVAQELWRLPWIGKTYSSRVLGWVALALALPALGVMRLMKRSDRGSTELLTFGWQIVARKA
jgi:ubiquinone/menaquinone biosynthesis C-methylase UbiE